MSRPPQNQIDIRIDEALAGVLAEGPLIEIAQRALAAEGQPPTELDITVTDDETVRALNRDYAGLDEPTDVLSFSLTEGEPFVSPPDGRMQLGEVVIAYPTAQRQAAERGQPTDVEVAHLLAHGPAPPARLRPRRAGRRAADAREGRGATGKPQRPRL